MLNCNVSKKGSTAELPVAPEIDNEAVALIVGGFWSNPEEGIVVSGAELFGCPGSVDPVTGDMVSIPVNDYPIPMYLGAGTYYEQDGMDEENQGRAIVCGGYSCPDGL